MKYVKEGLFWFVIFYTIVFSFLFIKQAFVVHDTMYKPVVLVKNEKYENVIMESKRKLQKYRVLSKTQEERACLDEIQKGINYSYQKQHANVSNYKEAKKYYYSLDEDTLHNNFSNIMNICNFDKEDSRTKDLSKYFLSIVPILEAEFIQNNYIFLPRFEFSTAQVNMISAITSPAFSSLYFKTEQDIRGRLINSDINYIKLLLEMVGEKYETE